MLFLVLFLLIHNYSETFFVKHYNDIPKYFILFQVQLQLYGRIVLQGAESIVEREA